jgi:hypothetical protein
MCGQEGCGDGSWLKSRLTSVAVTLMIGKSVGDYRPTVTDDDQTVTWNHQVSLGAGMTPAHYPKLRLKGAPK